MSNNDKLDLSLKEYLDGKFADFNRRMNDRFAVVDQQFEGVNQQFDGVNQQFDGIHRQFDGINQRIDDKHVAHEKATEAQFKALHKKINLIYGLVLFLLIIIITLIAKDYFSPNQNAETAMLVETLQRILQADGGNSVD